MNPWDRRPDESPEWHQRLIDYCGLGPLRTLAQLWTLDCLARGRDPHKPLPKSWLAAAQSLEWEERALAWDLWEADRALLPEQHRRAVARRRRLQFIQQVLALAKRTLDAAEISHLEREEARKLLPVVRQVMRDMLAAERSEYALRRGEEGGAAESAADLLAFNADELAQAEADLRRRLAAGDLPGDLPGDNPGAPNPLPAADAPSLPRLLVCIGPDPDLAVDLAMLRAVRRETGLGFHRLLNATRARLETALRRARGNARAVPWLHLACHAGPSGVARPASRRGAQMVSHADNRGGRNRVSCGAAQSDRTSAIQGGGAGAVSYVA